MPRRNACQTRVRRGNCSGVPTRLDGLLTDTLSQVNFSVVEVLEEVCEERVTIRSDRLLNSLKHRTVNALRVVRRLKQIRRNTAHNDRLADEL